MAQPGKVIGGKDVVIGEKEFRARIGNLAMHVSPRALRSGLGGALTVLAKGMRQQVNATTITGTPHPQSLKAGARKAIGSKVGRARAEMQGKVGFGVAKKDRSRKLSRGQSSTGLGVSAQDVHWFVLGTDERMHKSGHAVGELRAFFIDVAPRARAATGERALAVSRQRILATLTREAKGQVPRRRR